MNLLEVILQIAQDRESDTILILTAYEGALRVHEVLLLKLKDVDFDHKNYEVQLFVKSKKSHERITTLILSYRPC